MSDELAAETLTVPKSEEPTTAATKAPGRRRKSAAGAGNGDTAPKRPVGRPSNAEKLERQLADQLGAIALTVGLFNPADGLTIGARAPELAAAFARLAEQNPRIRKMLEGSLTSSAWLQLAVALSGLGLEIARNHRAPSPPPEPGPGLFDGLDMSAWADVRGGG